MKKKFRFNAKILPYEYQNPAQQIMLGTRQCDDETENVPDKSFQAGNAKWFRSND